MPGTFSFLFSGFSKLSHADRLARLIQMGALSPSDVDYLNQGGVQGFELAENLIENVIGYFQMPLGVATQFRINGVDYVIPMAVEETSIVAAASKTAKWVRENGTIQTQTLGDEIIGQIQVAKVKDFASFESRILENRDDLIQQANAEVAIGMVERGGGVQDLYVRRIPRGDGSDMAVVHVLLNACDAMGANLINQVCEFLKTPIEALTGERVTMCILSNLVDTKLTIARISLKGIDPQIAHDIAEASLFAQLDPYRAATNNKGVLNGIDPIAIATGNDWRAIEAGIHAFAARSGRYRSVTKWTSNGDELHGEFIAPVIVGTVGGVTKLHPTAKMGLDMMGIQSANQLAQIMAAVGLVQNLGALRALTSVGIIEGHMKLHIKNLAIGAGAIGDEALLVQKRLEKILLNTRRISMRNAVDALRDLRESRR
jgi:hydroxymethylglutaryl-CoA reductase